jgi:arylsulfatase A-like enzyme
VPPTEVRRRGEAQRSAGGGAAAGRAQGSPGVACAALLLVALLGGCRFPEERVSARFRLVELGSSARIATETILNESRPVLRAFPARPLAVDHGVEASRGDRVRLERPVPGLPPSVERVAVTTMTRRVNVLGGRSRWSRRTTRMVDVIRGTTFPQVEFPVALEWPLRPPRPGEVIRFEVRASLRIPPQGDDTRIDTAPVEIPRDASLEFGVGVLAEAREAGAVEFAVDACEGERCRPIFAESLDPEHPAAHGWQDRRVSLTEYAGRRISFRFDARPAGRREGSFTLPVWSDPTVYAVERQARSSPNVLLISLDTLRADHLGSYGYPRDTAPFIEARLAREGTVFERAVTSATTTGASHMTIFTSLQPSVHRLVGITGPGVLPDGALTLAEALRAHGFETGAVTEDAAIARHRGFERGFGSYVETDIGSSPKGAMSATLAAGRRWIDRVGERRFFLFLHTYQVHYPYVPPQEYGTLFEGAPPRKRVPAGLPEEWHPDAYDREIRYTDDLLGEFLGDLETRGLLDGTLVVVTSDHGEAFLEHGYVAHGAGLHEEILRVPLIFRGPGVPAGRRVDATVGLVDLMPTLLDLTGVPAVPGLMGRSFADVVRGGPPEPTWSERPFFSEAWRGVRVETDEEGQLRWVDVPRPGFAVRVGSRKLIRYRDGDGFRYSYYDLDSDPGEERDLYREDPESSRDLRRLIEEYVEATAELKDRLSGDRSGGAGPLDPEREERLRALGYIR